MLNAVGQEGVGGGVNHRITVNLDEGDKLYFICGVANHCSEGNMKLVVTVNNTCTTG